MSVEAKQEKKRVRSRMRVPDLFKEDTAYVRYLLKFGEISLKGKNRRIFEDRLAANILAALEGKALLHDRGKRFLLDVPEAQQVETERILGKIFGLVGFTRLKHVEPNLEALKAAAAELALAWDKAADDEMGSYDHPKSFKVECKRTDKQFPLKSYEIAAQLGGAVLEARPDLGVDVKTPQRTLYVELRHGEAYLYDRVHKGLGGLPVGSSGKGLLLLSGGIDSPVAGYQMAKRGLVIESIYFHTYPYTSDEAKAKVAELARRIAPYTGSKPLHVIPFTEVQEQLATTKHPKFATILMRMAMVKIAAQLARQIKAGALITGESLGQVASQTIESITCTNSSTDMLIMRPLIAMDKEEIIKISRDIECFETSILPYDDCCTLFSPDHPVIHPKWEELKAEFDRLELDQLLADALKNEELIGGVRI